MKLSRKSKLRSCQVHDHEIKRIAIFLTVIVVVAIWIPLKSKDLYETSKTLAVTSTWFVFIWMGATALSKIADYTSLTVSLAGIATIFWAGPPLLCNYLVKNWTPQPQGLLKFLIILTLTCLITWLVTLSLKNRRIN